MSEIEVKELTSGEFNTNGGSRGKWDQTGITDYAKELSKKYSNKVIGLPLENFYQEYYHGTHRIKYIGYYCRKRLIDAFEALNIKADVRQTKNQILISLKSEEVEADTDESEEDDTDEE